MFKECGCAASVAAGRLRRIHKLQATINGKIDWSDAAYNRGREWWIVTCAHCDKVLKGCE